ncbi:MAG: DUF3098 domain-containing protein, partial [Bacteroidetes bacterium]
MKNKDINKTLDNADKQTSTVSKSSQFAFGKENYKLLLIGLVLIA